MTKIRIGVICPSEIAFRRFIPALAKHPIFEYAGIAVASVEEWFGSEFDLIGADVLAAEREKAQKFADVYGGKIFNSYKDLLASSEVNAVYLPLPPALHYKWGKAALENGKHVFMEKPFTTSLADTKDLIALAKEKGLALHENYMFQYHSQLGFIKDAVASGQIGDLRLIRIAFGFPFRGASDFRYSKELGGGALLDCGGYTVKLASILLGKSAQVTSSQLNHKDGLEVDIYGSATMVNNSGATAQLSFGMDNSYKCELEIWGSKGTVYTNRILTAPDEFEPVIIIKAADGEKVHTLAADDTFSKSIQVFEECIRSKVARNENCKAILRQAEQVENFCKEMD